MNSDMKYLYAVVITILAIIFGVASLLQVQNNIRAPKEIELCESNGLEPVIDVFGAVIECHKINGNYIEVYDVNYVNGKGYLELKDDIGLR